MALLRASIWLRDQPGDWSGALHAAHLGIAELGGARTGDRTMLDALVPASDAFANAIKAGQTPAEALRAAVDAAESGAKATAAMEPRKGRSSYLGGRAIGHVDPGAEAVAVWLRAVAAGI
jgi:dihydroxyacetone kinase